MTKYYLKGLDCAVCAAKIETELRKKKGFEFAAVNFATKTLALDADAEELAKNIIGGIEPSVELVRADAAAAKEEITPGTWPVARIVASAALLVVGSVFGVQLRATPAGFAEHLVLLPAYLLVGYPVLMSAWRDLRRGTVFNEMFLMAIATMGAIAIGELAEAVGVMLFYSIGEYLQERAVAKSRNSISLLMDLRPEFARVVSGGEGRLVEPEQVAVGDIVEVRPGERIPLDGTIVEGNSYVDTSSLTGESVPMSVGLGQAVKAGYVNDSGRILVEVSAPFGQSSVARILDLVENAAAQKAPTEKFMTKVAAVYTPVVVAAAALIAVVPPLFVPGAVFSDWLYRALVLLVISCPCALVISIPLGYFGGVGSASRHKVLVKGASSLDALLKVDTVVFDKTGTLTKGSFEVVKIAPAAGFGRGEVLGLAAAAERFSSHPIAAAIRRAGAPSTQETAAVSGPKAAMAPAAAEVSDAREEKGRGVSAIVDGRRVLAGSTGFLMSWGVVIGSAEIISSAGVADDVAAAPIEAAAAGTLVHVAVDGRYAGLVVVADAVKEEAAETVAELKSMGVRRVVMLSGDREAAAARVAAQVCVDDCIAELLPEDKVAWLESLKASAPAGRKVVFVGDGMNDAPVLMRSDIGIAMGGLGSDAAIEAADAVIMDDRIARLPAAMKIAAFTRRIVLQNVVFSLGVKGVFLLLGAAGRANMWEAVIADVGVALIAVLNSIRAARFNPPGA